jgi:hypothetical protein
MRPGAKRRYLLTVSAITVCGAPLYVLACDYSRWFSNLTTSADLLAIFVLARDADGEPLGAALLGAVATFQFFFNQGFGIVTPRFGGISAMTANFWAALTHLRNLW